MFHSGCILDVSSEAKTINEAKQDENSSEDETGTVPPEEDMNQEAWRRCRCWGRSLCAPLLAPCPGGGYVEQTPLPEPARDAQALAAVLFLFRASAESCGSWEGTLQESSLPSGLAGP